MTRNLIWSPLAEKDFISILEYLENNWERKVLENFIELTDVFVNQIILNPKQFPLINKPKNIRKCVLTKQNTLFYRVNIQSIDILRIYDTRQNPKTLKFN